MLQKSPNTFVEENSIISESSDEIRQIPSGINQSKIGEGNSQYNLMKQASPTFGVNNQANFEIKKAAQ